MIRNVKIKQIGVIRNVLNMKKLLGTNFRSSEKLNFKNYFESPGFSEDKVVIFRSTVGGWLIIYSLHWLDSELIPRLLENFEN